MLRVVQMKEFERARAERAVECPPDILVGTNQIVPGGKRVAGIEAYAHALVQRRAHALPDRGQVLEPASDRGAGPRGQFKQYAGSIRTPVERLRQSRRVAGDSARDVAVGGVPRMRDEKVQPQIAAARQLCPEAVQGPAPEPRIRGRQVDEVGVVCDGTPDTGGRTGLPEGADPPVVEGGLGPAVRLLGEELKVEGGDVPRTAGRALDAARYRNVGAELVGDDGGSGHRRGPPGPGATSWTCGPRGSSPPGTTREMRCGRARTS